MKHQWPHGKNVVRSGEIKALTGLRIVAAVWVVLFHFRPLLAMPRPDFSTHSHRCSIAAPKVSISFSS